MPSLSYTLNHHGVTLLNDQTLLFQCDKCGQLWSPNLLPNGGRLPKGYWKCPNKCNYEPEQFKHTPEVRAYFAERNRKQRTKV